MTAPSPMGRETVHPQPPTPAGEGKAKGGSELVQRLISAAILIPSVLFVIAQGGLWVMFTVMLFVLLAQREFYGLIEGKGAHPITGFGLAAGGVLPVVAYLGNEYHTTLVMTATLLVVMIAQLQRQPKAVESRIRKLGIDVAELGEEG